MALGQAVEISLGVRDLDRTLAFFDLLGFARVEAQRDWLDRYAVIEDGVVTVGLYEGGGERPALTWFSPQPKPVRLTAGDRQVQPPSAETFGRPAIYDPRGLWLAVSGEPSTPSPPLDLSRGFPHHRSIARCGTFGELALPAIDLELSIMTWELLDFEVVHRAAQPYPWAILTDKLIVVGLHQTVDFSSPHLTYFSPDSADRIAALKRDGLRFDSVMRDDTGGKANARLVTPDLHGIYVFQG